MDQELLTRINKVTLLPRSPLLSMSVNNNVPPLRFCLRNSSDLVSSAELLILLSLFLDDFGNI